VSLKARVSTFFAELGDRLRFGFKALQIFYDRSTIPQSITGSSTTGLHSNVLMAPVMWLMRAFTEAQLVTQRRREDSGGGIIWERVIDHPVEVLIDSPNEAYDGDALWKATVISYVLAGNAYWRKVRNVFGVRPALVDQARWAVRWIEVHHALRDVWRYRWPDQAGAA
jgi:phage portal protein BeeE